MDVRAVGTVAADAVESGREVMDDVRRHREDEVLEHRRALPVDCREHRVPRLSGAASGSRGVESLDVEVGERLGQLDDPVRVPVLRVGESAREATRDQDIGTGEDAAGVVFVLQRDPALVEPGGERVEP